MGLDSIWSKEGDWLMNKKEGFKARSTGCSCCATDLYEEEDVKREAIDSLRWVLVAADYFGWSRAELIDKAEKLHKDEVKKSKEEKE